MGRKRIAKWFGPANKRRCELIHRDIFDKDLTEEEKLELQILQKKCLDEVNRVHPIPINPELERILEKYKDVDPIP